MTLIELIVVLALIGIILPLLYNVYFNEINIHSYISSNVNAQAEGRDAINQINSDLRLGKKISNDFIDITSSDSHIPDYGIKDISKDFSDVNQYFKDNGFDTCIYYVESLTNSEPFYYAIKQNTNGLDDVYKVLLDEDSTGGSMDVYKLLIPPDNNVYIANLTNIESVFSYDSEEMFENNALYGATKSDIRRNQIEINNIPSLWDYDSNTFYDFPANPTLNTNEHFIVLGCFKFNDLNYVYFIHDTNGAKCFGKLADPVTVDVPKYKVNLSSIAKPLISNVKHGSFEITHTGITYNIKFQIKTHDDLFYPFNVDVNPLNLGGGV